MSSKNIAIGMLIVLVVLLTSFIFVYIAKYHKFPIKPVVLEDTYRLKNKLNDISSSRHNHHCEWKYGYDNEYHIFMLVCLPWETENTTYQIAEKKYKIKQSLLKIDDTYMYYGEKKFDRRKDLDAWNGPPVGVLNICW